LRILGYLKTTILKCAVLGLFWWRRRLAGGFSDLADTKAAGETPAPRKSSPSFLLNCDD
jgi:hypothetical protein